MIAWLRRDVAEYWPWWLTVVVVVIVLLLAGCSAPVGADGPPQGVLNAAVTQQTIHQTICVPGWTAGIRPPSSYTSALKRQQIAERHLADTNMSDYEEDHFVPLELGGHPTDPGNLWPEPWPDARKKDKQENALRAMVCAGTMSLDLAQRQIEAWR